MKVRHTISVERKLSFLELGGHRPEKAGCFLYLCLLNLVDISHFLAEIEYGMKSATTLTIITGVFN